MSGNKKQPLVPRLRFPEFKNTAEWQSPTLGEVSEPVEERVGERKLTPVSISAGIGFVPQAEKFGRDISGSQYKLYTVVRDGDFVYNKGNSLKFPQGCVYDLQGWGEVAAPNVFICFRLKNGYENGFYRQCFERNVHGIQLRKHITSGARSNGLLNISKEAFYGVAIPVPSHAEQQKIADCLSSLDDLIAAETYKLDTLKTHKKGLMQQLFPREGETVPRLRFPEFREAPAWGKEKLEKLITTVSPPSKLQSSNYGTQGKFPIIDQSQEFICGWTDDERAVITESLPLIIFGDHTCALKFVDKPFAQGADGIKILKVRPAISAEYLFHSLSHRPLAMEDYKRHFSMLKERAVVFPDIESGEQQKIADCLSSLDDLITAQTQKIDALKTHKKGLMQQLFPTLDEVDA